VRLGYLRPISRFYDELAMNEIGFKEVITGRSDLIPAGNNRCVSV